MPAKNRPHARTVPTPRVDAIASTDSASNHPVTSTDGARIGNHPVAHSSTDGAKIGNHPVAHYSGEHWAEECFRRGLVAAHVAEEIAADARQPGTARVGAARLLAELAGMVGAGRTLTRPGTGDQVSTDELRGIVARLDREIADRAKVVAPRDDDIDAQLLES